MATLNDPKSEASYHYLIVKKKGILQVVEEENTAWHAGRKNKPSAALIELYLNPNTYTIGIAFVGYLKNGVEFMDILWCAFLIADICKRERQC